MPQIDPVILRLEVDLRSYQAGLSQAQRLSDKSLAAIASKALQAGRSIREGLGTEKIPDDLKVLLQEIEVIIGRINDSASGRTTREKRATALELIDGTFSRRRADIQEGIAHAQSSRELLQELERLAQLEAAFKHQSPLEKRRDELALTRAELEDTFEQLGVKGLQTLEDGLFSAIRGVKELGDVFKDVANQIIADLLRIAIRQAIVKPLSDLLFSGLGRIRPPALGKATPGTFEYDFDKTFAHRIPARASGGSVQAGQLYRINEAASPGRVEGFIPQGAGEIIPLGRMNALASPVRSGPAVINVTVNAKDAVLTHTVQQWVRDGVAAAAQLGTIGGAAEGERRVMSRGRRRIPG